MTIDVSGGAGGTQATYHDLMAEAGVLDDRADDVRSRADDVAAVGAHSAVLGAAFLCPVEAGVVEVHAVAAATGPTGLLPMSAALEVSARLLRASVVTYATVDAAQEGAFDAISRMQGWLLGHSLPGAGVLLLGLAAGNPLLAGLTAAYLKENSAAIGAELQQTLFDNPWLLEELVHEAPWLIQGLADGVGGPLLPLLLSGGSWPTGSYEDAVGGLINAGGWGGLFQDDGGFHVEHVAAGNGTAPHGIADVFAEQAKLSGETSTVQISTVVGDDGVTRYVVQVPGTQEWSPTRGDNLSDLTSNLTLMSGRQSELQRQVMAAMKAAGIGPDDPVMLTGHSQGGIVCAALASDPAQPYRIEAVVTGGSPIANFPIPPDVSVLSLEHDQDVVPMLDGERNPDDLNWVTVRRSVAEQADGIGAAHSTDLYRATGQAADTSADPSLTSWRAANEGFFHGDATVDRYAIRPDE